MVKYLLFALLLPLAACERPPRDCPADAFKPGDEVVHKTNQITGVVTYADCKSIFIEIGVKGFWASPLAWRKNG